MGKIFKTGHSAAVTLSSALLKDLGLKIGDSVEIRWGEARGQAIISPRNKPSQLALNLHARPRLGSGGGR